MTTHSVSNPTLDDELLSEEPMMFPYLLELESDTEHTTESATAPTSTAALTVAKTPVTVDQSTELVNRLNDTLNSVRKQLNEAREDIKDLRQIVFQNDVRIREYELRLAALENPASPPTPHAAPAEEDTDTDCTPPPAKRVKISPTNPSGNYKGKKPLCFQCTRHHKGPCAIPIGRCKPYPKSTNSPKAKLCFNCGNAGHFKAQCPLTPGNKTKGTSLPDNCLTTNTVGPTLLL